MRSLCDELHPPPSYNEHFSRGRRASLSNKKIRLLDVYIDQSKREDVTGVAGCIEASGLLGPGSRSISASSPVVSAREPGPEQSSLVSAAPGPWCG